MISKLRSFVFFLVFLTSYSAQAQTSALLEACNAIEDKSKRLICLQELTSIKAPRTDEVAAIKRVKEAFASIEGVVSTGLAYNNYKELIVEPARALGVFKSENINADPKALAYLTDAVSAYNDAERIWRSHIFDSQDGGLFFGRVLNYQALGLTSIVNKYSLPTTTVLMNPHLPFSSALPLIWQHAEKSTRLAFEILEGKKSISTNNEPEPIGAKFEIIVPDQITEGGVIPIHIKITGYESDPIKFLSVSIDNNPQPYKQAFKIELVKPVENIFTSSRIRSGTTGILKFTITLTHQSGKSTIKSFEEGFVQKAIDFNNLDSLNVVFNGSFNFPTNEVGQPQKISRQKKYQSEIIEFRGLLNHPMIPPTSDSPNGFYVNRIDFMTGSDLVATITTTPVLSNNPYIQLEIPSPLDPSAITMTWKDTKGSSFTR